MNSTDKQEPNYTKSCTLEPKEWEERFNARFTKEWWNGFGTTDEIDARGKEGIIDFIANLLEEAYEKGMKDYILNTEKLLEEQKRDIKEDIDYHLALLAAHSSEPGLVAEYRDYIMAMLLDKEESD